MHKNQDYCAIKAIEMVQQDKHHTDYVSAIMPLIGVHVISVIYVEYAVVY